MATDDRNFFASYPFITEMPVPQNSMPIIMLPSCCQTSLLIFLEQLLYHLPLFFEFLHNRKKHFSGVCNLRPIFRDRRGQSGKESVSLHDHIQYTLTRAFEILRLYSSCCAGSAHFAHGSLVMEMELCAGSKCDVIESGRVCCTLAGSSRHTVEPGYDEVSIDEAAELSLQSASCSERFKGVSLTKRQRKRNSDKKRKKRLFSEAFCLNSTIDHQSEVLANAEKEVDSLRVQKMLYQA